MDSKSHNISQAIGFMITSMACFAMMSACVRLASAELATTQVVLMRNLLVLLMLLPWIVVRGFHLLRTQKAGQHFSRSLLGIISMHLWFLSLHIMPMNIATALSFTSPIFVSIIAIIILRERSTVTRWLAIATGLVGALVILRPGTQAVEPTALLALSAAFIIAIVSVWIKHLSKTETTEAMLFYMALFMTIFSLPGGFIAWEPLTQQSALSCFGVAAFSLLAHLLLIFAYRRADMTTLMPFDFVRLLFTAIIAWWLFDEHLDIWTAAGATLIISGSLLAARESNRMVREDIARAQRVAAKE